MTDTHRVKRLYDELATAVSDHQPDVVALVGDFLDAMGTTSEQYSTSEAAELLAQLLCREVVFVRGNHEDEDWLNFAAAWSKTGRRLNALHGEVFLSGPLTIVGFPCGLGDETAFLGVRQPLPEPPSTWLLKLFRGYRAAMRTLWLMHEPPMGTPLTEKHGPLAGNPQWNEALARFSPWLTVSGHDHDSPGINKRWFYHLGQTMCVNLGQPGDDPLHYCVIEAHFTKTKPSLPTEMKVSAFPWRQSLSLPQRR